MPTFKVFPLVRAGIAFAILSLAVAPLAQTTASALADTTVLIIRHGEKPVDGTELAPAGVERAKNYPAFFKSFMVDGKTVHIDHIFATADSKSSHRERLTVEPLAKSLGLTIDDRFKNKEFGDLVATLKTKSYGKTVLICWHHGKIPELMTALGADPAKLLPEGKWPAENFSSIIQLRYGPDGQLVSQIKR